VILSRERVLNRLSQLSHEAQQRGHYSAAARCEELIGKEIGMFVFVDRTAFLWETDPEKLSDRQLQVLGDYLVKKAEEEEIKAKRQIEAGTLVIDAQSTEVEST